MLVLISTLWMELIIGECQELLLIKIVAITHVQVAIIVLIILRLTLYLATHAILVVSILIFILFAIEHDATALSHVGSGVHHVRYFLHQLEQVDAVLGVSIHDLLTLDVSNVVHEDLGGEQVDE